jgi:hypothetical protein
VKPYGYYNMNLMYETSCSRCHAPLGRGARVWYSKSLGQALCPDCFVIEYPTDEVKIRPQDLTPVEIKIANAPSRSVARRIAAQEGLPPPRFEGEEEKG